MSPRSLMSEADAVIAARVCLQDHDELTSVAVRNHVGTVLHVVTPPFERCAYDGRELVDRTCPYCGLVWNP